MIPNHCLKGRISSPTKIWKLLMVTFILNNTEKVLAIKLERQKAKKQHNQNSADQSLLSTFNGLMGRVIFQHQYFGSSFLLANHMQQIIWDTTKNIKPFCVNLLAADHLVLIVFPGQCHQWRLNNATPKPQNKVQCGLCKDPIKFITQQGAKRSLWHQVFIHCPVK